jgi:hypothetical protein
MILTTRLRPRSTKTVENLVSSSPSIKTIPEFEFEMGAKKINLNWAHSFVEFENLLQGQYKMACKQVPT